MDFSFSLNKKILLTSLLLLLIYLSPNLFFLDDSKYLVGDNLNQHIPINKILVESKALSADSYAKVPYIMGGIERAYLKSELKFVFLIYKVFPIQIAYAIIRILMHLVAFFGMYFFLSRYVFFNKEIGLISILALSFATLPFFTNGFLTIAGQPLLLYCLLNIFNKKSSVFDWNVIALFPFFSSLVLGNFFFLFFISVTYMIYILLNRDVNWKLIIALLLFSITTVVAEYRLFIFQFNDQWETARIEMLRLGNMNLKGVVGMSLAFFIDGHRHFLSLHFPFILIVVGSVPFFVNFAFWKKWMFPLMGVIIFSVVFEQMFYGWSVFNDFKTSSVFLNSFTFRFYALLPIAWYLTYGFSVKYLIVQKRVKIPLYILLSLVLVNNFFGTANIAVENSFFHTFFNDDSKTHYSFNEYYSPYMFNEIKQEINLKENEIIGCVGFPSAIANYNQISTIGGFLNNYPLEYKDRMRKVIQPEIKRNKNLNEWFNNYGVVCELLSSETYKKNGKKKIEQFNIDLDKLRVNDCFYILSSIPIGTFDKKMMLVKKITNRNKNAYLKSVFIYKV